jgi:hypothetical protein
MKSSLHCLGSKVDSIPVGGPMAFLFPYYSKASWVMEKGTRQTPPAGPCKNRNKVIVSRCEHCSLVHKKNITHLCTRNYQELACVMSNNSPYRDYAQTGNLTFSMVNSPWSRKQSLCPQWSIPPSLPVGTLQAESWIGSCYWWTHI